MIFPVNFPEARDVIAQTVQNRIWVDKETIKAEIWPLKKTAATNTDGFGLPYKSSHKIFTKSQLGLNMRILDGDKKYLVSEPQGWGSHWEAFLSLVIMDDFVKITRQGVTGTSPSGGQITGPVTVVESLSCYLIPAKGNVVVVTAGQTSISYVNMYCDMVDIKVNDVVVDLSTGSKYKVITVKQFTQVAYTYAYLQGGVV